MNESAFHKPLGARRWFRFTYLLSGRDGRELYPHQTRDGDAALPIQDVLSARGYRLGGPIYNYHYSANWPPPKAGVPMDDSFLRPHDLLVLTTRPPLHDFLDGVRNPVRRSYTTLEEKVFTCIHRHLSHCSRARVTVSDTHTRKFAEVERMGNVLFRQKRGAAIDAVLMYDTGTWRRGSAALPTTVAYLIFEEQAWENGPGVLASFGMSGTDTLGWNFILATRYPELIATVPFVMAEITTPERPARPRTLDFLDDWKVRLLTSYDRSSVQA